MFLSLFQVNNSAVYIYVKRSSSGGVVEQRAIIIGQDGVYRLMAF